MPKGRKPATRPEHSCTGRKRRKISVKVPGDEIVGAGLKKVFPCQFKYK
jgi:hypothetical protein